ncbi:MAG: NTP transferase domain-containing protein [Elusimicrobiales bacterium]|nr:NTP transferase domain-containing protein [Elusimicrobiales bacterium]
MIKHAGIFAAGHGLRLKKTFPNLIKPIIPIKKKPLIEWMLKLLREAGFNKISILFNSRGEEAARYLNTLADFKGDLTFIVKDTESSWESFSLLSKEMAKKSENFLLTTVDSFYKPKEIKNLINKQIETQANLVLGITDKVHDEKPLWSDIEPSGRIVNIGHSCLQKKYITSGLYLVTKTLADEMPAAETFPALRYYLANLVLRNKKIWSHKISASVDVDDANDIILAEEFIDKYLSL